MAVSIAVLGDRNTDHLTHREIDATLELMPADVDARWLPSPEAGSAVEADGLWVAPGTPYRDGEAVLAQIRRARTAGMPILGTCGGFQHMLLEFARNVAGLEDAAHAETDPDAADPVVARLSCSLVGEERPVTAVAGTRVAALCGTEPFTGFHWCNYGLVPEREAELVAAGLVVAARARRGRRGGRAARPSVLRRDALPAPGRERGERAPAPADRRAGLSRARRGPGGAPRESGSPRRTRVASSSPRRAREGRAR